MAVFTEVGRESLERYLSHYDLPDLVSYEGIEAGIENTNYRLTTGSETFILTLFEGRTSGDDLPYYVDLMSHLAGRGFPCPMPIGPSKPEAPQLLEGKPALIVTFLPGRPVEDPCIHHCGLAGEMLARLHLLAEDFPRARDNGMSLPKWHELAAEIGEGAETVGSELSRTISEELDYLTGAWPTSPKCGTIHADFFADNVLWVGDRISGVIDFYYACTDALAYDLALTVNAWCCKDGGDVDRGLAQAMIGGYLSVNPLATEDLVALPVFLRGAALRILLTRVFDQLHGDPDALVVPKDPLEYLRILQFHQNNPGLQNYGL